MEMKLENCPRCGKIFAKGLRDICPNCVKDIDKEYERCAAFLKEHRKCNIQELSEGAEVSIRQITRFIREGRISMTHAPNLAYPCESCGEPIRDGGMCANCRSKLAREVGAVSQSEQRQLKQQPNQSSSAYNISNRLRDH